MSDVKSGFDKYDIHIHTTSDGLLEFLNVVNIAIKYLHSQKKENSFDFKSAIHIRSQFDELYSAYTKLNNQ